MISPDERAEVKALFDFAGLSIRQFAQELNVDPATVHRVLSGQSACSRGNSHRIAVILGLKKGVIAKKDASAAETLKQARKLIADA